MTDFRCCAVIPNYNNADTVRSVVQGATAHLDTVIVVDDGSEPAVQEVLDQLERENLAHVHRRAKNGGKGAAVKTGLVLASQLGFTHALQVDADGQHALEDIPRLLDQAQQHPEALVLGAPRFDQSAPRSRRIGRRITTFWTNRETGGQVIEDAMCGFRVYPVAAALHANARANRMDFDIEIAVRLVWRGLSVMHVPTQVRYLAAEQGGVSHFRLVRDNVWISLTHARLVLSAGWRFVRTAMARIGKRLRREL